MKRAKQKAPAPAFYYNGTFVDVTYSFSEYTQNKSMNTDKVWLDILFLHPQQQQAVLVQVPQPALVLCQSKEVVESIVHREIRNFLHFSDSAYFSTAPVHQAVA